MRACKRSHYDDPLGFPVLLSHDRSSLMAMASIGLIMVSSWLVTHPQLHIATAAPNLPIKIPALIIFGDSTVDVGMNNNVTTVIKANFRPYGVDFITGEPTGRFCDGQVPVDYVATFLGLPFPLAYFDPEARGQNIVKGINFASSGSGYNDNTAKFFNVYSLTKQLEFFENYKSQLAELVGSAQAAQIVSGALYVLSTGSNDYATNYFFNLRLRSKLNRPQYNQFLLQQASNFLEKLYSAGVRKLVIVNVPPLGCLPAERSLLGRLDFRDCVESSNEAASTFNTGLQGIIRSVRAKYSDYRPVIVDCYGPILDMYKNPSNYGLEEVKKGCCSTGRVEVAILCNPIDAGLSCKDPSKHLFWDSYHPTQTVYKMLTDKFIQEVLSSDILS